VTGAAGFVGCHVVRALLARGEIVRALVRPTSDLRNLDGLPVELVQGDLLDVSSVLGAMAGCDVVYHVAAFYSTRPEDARQMYLVNVQGTKLVCHAARRAGVRRLIHTSTIGTIGRPANGSLPDEETEFNLWETASHYARSKFLGELVALNMAAAGLPVVVVHPCAPVGPLDRKPTSTGQRIVDFLRGKRPAFAPGGINFVPVEDVAVGHVLAAERGRVGERYILGHRDGNLDEEAFLSLLERVSGQPRPVECQDSWRNWIRGVSNRLHVHPTANYTPAALTANPSRAIVELGLPQSSLTEAFAAAVRWFRENGYVPQGKQVDPFGNEEAW